MLARTTAGDRVARQPNAPVQPGARWAGLREAWKHSRNPLQVVLLHPRGWSLILPMRAVGVRVTKIDPLHGDVQAHMPLLWRNMNVIGTQFGGALYTLVDPFHVYLVNSQLGSDYLVWDSTATINFIRPALDGVYLDIHVDRTEIDDIRARVAQRGATTHRFSTTLRDASGTPVAEVEKVLHVARATRGRPRPVRSSGAAETLLRRALRPLLDSSPGGRSVEVAVVTPDGTLVHHITRLGRSLRLQRGASTRPVLRLTLPIDTLRAIADGDITWARAVAIRKARVSGRWDWSWWFYQTTRKEAR